MPGWMVVLLVVGGVGAFAINATRSAASGSSRPASAARPRRPDGSQIYGPGSTATPPPSGLYEPPKLFQPPPARPSASAMAEVERRVDMEARDAQRRASEWEADNEPSRRDRRPPEHGITDNPRLVEDMGLFDGPDVGLGFMDGPGTSSSRDLPYTDSPASDGGDRRFGVGRGDRQAELEAAADKERLAELHADRHYLREQLELDRDRLELEDRLQQDERFRMDDDERRTSSFF